jgi:hypothetical protein
MEIYSHRNGEWGKIAGGKDWSELWMFRTALRVAIGFEEPLKLKQGHEEFPLTEHELRENMPGL